MSTRQQQPGNKLIAINVSESNKFMAKAITTVTSIDVQNTI